jgi:plastocyanin
MIAHRSIQAVLRVRVFVVAATVATLVACGSGSSSGPTEEDTGSVEGEVVSTTGGGVAGAALTLTRTGHQTRTATSGTDGTFAIQNVAAGSWSLSVTAPQGWTVPSGQPSQRSVNVPAGGTAQATFQLQASGQEGSLAGTIRHDGAGVADVTISLSNGDGFGAEETTGTDGAFQFQALDPGSYTLEISPPGYFNLAPGHDAVRTIEIVPNAEETVSIELAPGSNQETYEITLGDSSFTPPQLTVAPGSRIRWVSASTMAHTITPSGHDAWARAEITNQGQTFEAVLNNPGEFEYFCEPHAALGMAGVIWVEVPSGGGA